MWRRLYLLLNRAAQHEMEVDLKNKFTAQQLDETAIGMKNSSVGVHYYEGVENIEQCLSVPETWNQHVNDIVNRSRSERAASRKLREEIGTSLAQIAQYLSDHWNDVNAALAERIREVTEARNQLQASLGHTLQEISDTEKEIERLKAAIRSKEEYLKTATSRLNIRLRRPGMEHICDAAQMQLKCEVAQIKDSIALLHSQLCRAQDMLQELLRLRSAKEAELAVKNNSIFIDREKCLALRNNWPGGPTATASHGAPCPSIADESSSSVSKECSC
ncbi:Tektin-3 [Fasciola gigantica]|uniref:Tektin n=1 Tax=Fasciola gigantica TaxID=46835 RepID=A0A504YJD5_FASGI|nr:Tektin-3 [Fasciola gigantica]